MGHDFLVILQDADNRTFSETSAINIFGLKTIPWCSHTKYRKRVLAGPNPFENKTDTELEEWVDACRDAQANSACGTHLRTRDPRVDDALNKEVSVTFSNFKEFKSSETD